MRLLILAGLLFGGTAIHALPHTTAIERSTSNLAQRVLTCPLTTLGFGSAVNPGAFVCGCSGTSTQATTPPTLCQSDPVGGTCARGCPDCGPYTPINYDRQKPPTSEPDLTAIPANCPGYAGDLYLFQPEADHPDATDIPLSDDDLFAYKNMELQILAQALKDGDGGNTPIDLPYCGIGSWSGDGTPISKRSYLSKTLGSAGKKLHDTFTPDAPNPPHLPVCVQFRLRIPVYFNIITLNCTTQSLITQQVINDAMSQINSAYNPHNIDFYLNQDSVNYFVDDPAAQNGNDYRQFANAIRGGTTPVHDTFNDQFMMRRQFRHGGKDVLHLFIIETVTSLDTKTNLPVSGRTLGFCHFPQETGDGCAFIMDTLKGVSFQDFDTQPYSTIVHEIGHWFNLKHTHDESGENADICKGSDDIQQTNQYPFDNRHCPYQYPCVTVGTSFEPSTKLEPVYNFMSYSPIRNAFTQEQQAKAISQFRTFRKGQKGPLNCDGLNYVDTKEAKRSFGQVLFDRPLAREVDRLRVKAVGKRGDYSFRRNIIEELKAICATPYAGDDDPVILSSWEFPNDDIRNTPGGDSEGGPTTGGGPVTSGPVSSSPPPSNVSYTVIHPNGDAKKCLDVEGNLRYNGGKVQVYDCNDTGAQRWVINNGNTKVRLADSGYCLDAGGDPGNGIGMKIWQCYDQLPAQAFYFTADRRIAVTGKGQCMDVKDGDHERGTVQTWLCTDNNTNQIWTV